MAIRELVGWDRPFSSMPTLHNNRFNRSLTSFQNEMNSLFDDFFNDVDLPYTATRQQRAFPAIDIVENNKNFKIKAEVPGMNPEDIEVDLTGGLLTIKGEKEEEKKEEEDNYLRHEVSYGSFHRTIALPESANTDKAQATFKNGILTIELPKKAEALKKPKKLQIKKAA